MNQSKEVKKILNESNIRSILWPPKSPDINIAEDAWKMIYDIVSDGPQYSNKKDLVLAIENAISHINSEQSQN